MIWFEYILDAGRLLKENGYKNVLVTNGMIEVEPLKELLPLIDAMNIDLKTVNHVKYKRILNGDLDTVQATIETAYKHCHIEVTHLIVTGFNDSEAEMRHLTDYLAQIDKNIVLHLSRYFPHHKYRQEPTPLATMERAYEIAKEKLAFVYLGNLISDKGQDTLCPSCGIKVVERDFYQARVVGISNGKCNRCGADLNIIGSD
jgi:pyruvate formate lyase activating enzyme